MAITLEDIKKELEYNNQGINRVVENTADIVSLFDPIFDAITTGFDSLIASFQSANFLSIEDARQASELVSEIPRTEATKEEDSAEQASMENVEELSEIQLEHLEQIEDTSRQGFKSLDMNFTKFFSFMRGQELRDYEAQREADKEKLRERLEKQRRDKEEKDQERRVDRMEKGGLLGEMMAGLKGGITGALSVLLAPLKAIAALLIKTGPLALFIFGLYTIFKDIGDNPVFKETIETIKDLWQNSIVPTFRAIREAFVGWTESEGYQNFLDMVTAIQNTFSRLLSDIVQLFATVFDGIGKIVRGLFGGEGVGMVLDGITTIVVGFSRAIINTFDNLITGIIELFGVSFGEDGTLFGFIGRKINEITDSIREMWDNLVNRIKSAISGIVSAVVPQWLQRRMGIDTDSEDMQEPERTPEQIRTEILEAEERRDNRRLERGRRKDTAEIERLEEELRVMEGRELEFDRPTFEDMSDMPPPATAEAFDVLEMERDMIEDATAQRQASQRAQQTNISSTTVNNNSANLTPTPLPTRAPNTARELYFNGATIAP